MTRIRKTILIAGVIQGVCFTLIAAGANAGSLLSGYGGPGEGNQAILGSQLVNGPKGGGPSAASSAPSSAQPGALSSAAGGSAPASSADGHNRRGLGAGRSGGVHGRQLSTAVHGRGRGQAPTKAGNVLPSAAVGSQPLGLSSADLVYTLLVLAALALTAATTKWLARRPRGIH